MVKWRAPEVGEIWSWVYLESWMLREPKENGVENNSTISMDSLRIRKLLNQFWV